LSLDLWISSGSAEAKAMTAEMFDKLQQLDIPALLM